MLHLWLVVFCLIFDPLVTMYQLTLQYSHNKASGSQQEAKKNNSVYINLFFTFGQNSIKMLNIKLVYWFIVYNIILCTSSPCRIYRCVHQRTWIMPYAHYISYWLIRQGWSPLTQHKSGCEFHCLSAHRSKHYTYPPLNPDTIIDLMT